MIPSRTLKASRLLKKKKMVLGRGGREVTLVCRIIFLVFRFFHIQIMGLELNIRNMSIVTMLEHITAGPAYYVLHPQKGITIWLFLTYQAFKNREGIVSQTNLAE